MLLAGILVSLAVLAAVERRVVAASRGATSGQGGTGTRRTLRARALRKRSAVLRPLHRPTATTDLGLRLGRSGRRDVWGSVEDSYLVLGPPRSGKTTGLLVPWLKDYPGPAVVTSTRPDLFVATREHRASRGPVLLFDPTQLVPDVESCSWDITSGCIDPLVAILRARAIVAASQSAEGVRNADFWRGTAETVLRCFLHAAALSGEDVRAIKRWVSQQNGVEALAALRSPGAADGWAADLAGLAQLNEETRSNVFAGVSTTLSALSDPRVCDAVGRSASMPALDLDRLLRERGTLYIVGTSGAQHSLAPVVVALVEAMVDRARRRAATMPGGRLDPPLGVFLDEAAQIAPLPSLPQLVADGGGSGITPVVALQSVAQARDRWGEPAADALWDACTMRLVLGGLGNDSDLQRISRLCGEVDHKVTTHHRSGPTVSTLRRPVLPPAEIRALRPGRALLLAKGLGPAVIRIGGS
jgi:type IV secretion system protein VirD4